LSILYISMMHGQANIR